MRILILAAAAAVLAAGCNGTTENGDGGGEKKDAWPTAGEWRRTNQPPAGYPPGDASVEGYAGEARAESLRRNGLQSLLVTQYLKEGFDADPKNVDTRRIRVELWRHQEAMGAAKTFQAWHGGHSINDVGEKAFADESAIVFLRANYVIRLVPTGPTWKKGEAAPVAIAVGRALDAWLSRK